MVARTRAECERSQKKCGWDELMERTQLPPPVVLAPLALRATCLPQTLALLGWGRRD